MHPLIETADMVAFILAAILAIVMVLFYILWAIMGYHDNYTQEGRTKKALDDAISSARTGTVQRMSKTLVFRVTTLGTIGAIWVLARLMY